jgi:hypothetical protein
MNSRYFPKDRLGRNLLGAPTESVASDEEREGSVRLPAANDAVGHRAACPLEKDDGARLQVVGPAGSDLDELPVADGPPHTEARGSHPKTAALLEEGPGKGKELFAGGGQHPCIFSGGGFRF